MPLGRHSGRASRVRRAAGHSCPQCRQPWSLTATHTGGGFLVTCRACDYSQSVSIPEPPEAPERLLKTS
jgi:Zn ribbon nucleic-acid-binding protein